MTLHQRSIKTISLYLASFTRYSPSNGQTSETFDLLKVKLIMSSDQATYDSLLWFYSNYGAFSHRIPVFPRCHGSDLSRSPINGFQLTFLGNCCAISHRIPVFQRMTLIWLCKVTKGRNAWLCQQNWGTKIIIVIYPIDRLLFLISTRQEWILPHARFTFPHFISCFSLLHACCCLNEENIKLI